jgi:sec-independent protein translocase protein TatA
VGEGLFQPMHLFVIFFIALLVFGPKKLPELGKGLGDGSGNSKRACAKAKPPTKRKKVTEQSGTEPSASKTAARNHASRDSEGAASSTHCAKAAGPPHAFVGTRALKESAIFPAKLEAYNPATMPVKTSIV